MHCVMIRFDHGSYARMQAMYFDDPMLAFLWAIAMSDKPCKQYTINFFKYDKPKQKINCSSFTSNQ